MTRQTYFEGVALVPGNSAREDLSFIERAISACNLDDVDVERAIIGEALPVDRAEVSKLVSVGRAVPRAVVLAIGKAAKAGRPRWQEFAEAVKTSAALKRVREAIADPVFARAAPYERFLRAFRAARGPAEVAASPTLLRFSDPTGAPLAELRTAKRQVRLELTKCDGARFAKFLAQRLPELCREFAETEGATD